MATVHTGLIVGGNCSRGLTVDGSVHTSLTMVDSVHAITIHMGYCSHGYYLKVTVHV